MNIKNTAGLPQEAESELNPQVVVEQIIPEEMETLRRDIRKPGMKLWQWDVETGIVSRVDDSQFRAITKAVFHMGAVRMSVTRAVKIEKGKWYVTALNLKNAMRKFRKHGRAMIEAAAKNQPLASE